MEAKLDYDITERPFFSKLKNSLENLPGIQKILNYKNYKNLPKRSEIKERLMTNYQKFAGLYLIFSALFLVFASIRNFLLLPIIASASFAILYTTLDKEVTIKGYKLKEIHIYAMAGIFSLVYLLFLNQALYSLVGSSLFLAFLSGLHSFFYHEKSEIEDFEEFGKGFI